MNQVFHGTRGLALIASLCAMPALADDLRKEVMGDGRNAIAARVEEALFPADLVRANEDCNIIMKSNGLACGLVAKPTMQTTSVKFGVGSAALTEDSKAFLDVVPGVLKKRIDYVVKLTVEGHTDATGSASFNRTLSTKRADAVRAYFAEKHGITKVATVGRGSDALKDPSNPAGAVNRRMEFVVSLPGMDEYTN